MAFMEVTSAKYSIWRNKISLLNPKTAAIFWGSNKNFTTGF